MDDLVQFHKDLTEIQEQMWGNFEGMTVNDLSIMYHKLDQLDLDIITRAIEDYEEVAALLEDFED